MTFFKRASWRFEVKIVLAKDFEKFAEMFDNQIRLRLAKLIEGVVTGQYGARVNSAMARGFDVVLHVADEKCFVGIELIDRENFVNFLALVPDADVGNVEILPEIGSLFLNSEMFRRDGAQQEGANFMGATKFEESACVWKGTNGRLHFAKATMKPGFQLRHRNAGRVLVVKNGEGQTEFRAELIE